MNENCKCWTIFGASNYLGNQEGRATSGCVLKVEKDIGITIFNYNSYLS